MPAIETDRLTKRYGSARGIEEVTVSVEKAEVFGFLGPNGAGKTTTIRARLGNLPGDFGYGKRTTGRGALRLLARLRGIRGSGRVEALAERFHTDLDRPLGELSRGNRARSVRLVT